MSNGTTLTTDELDRRLHQRGAFIFWNVLTEEYFSGELIPGSLWVPVDTVGREAKRLGLSPDAEIVVEADPPLLRTALLNLLENAAKYSPSGSQVHVLAENDGAMTTLHFRDACGGLAETQVERLFEPYYRGVPPRGVPGLGIGLYLVRELSRALGWRVDVENMPGEGCEFSVELPTAAEPPAD